ncbi:sensor histidine kinase [Chiayiivirga flava]|uniref:histidine kinase n=1 Tax=Chiayiivirga flava TaxID=659595 RepID=A0A7W8D4E4_9GAMM|nr:HAMP domain-containing sensor histidine kinase [Chiayiivirga flava]MBB5207709.1 NtrC-family two-component system sensor histidine kinase KinB [Chiayiivirga flava]
MRTMRLRTWLIGGYGVVLAVAVLGLALGLIAAVNLADISRRMVTENFESVENAARLRRLANDEQVALMGLPDIADTAIMERMRAFVARSRELLADARNDAGGDARSGETLQAVDDAIGAIARRVDAPPPPVAEATGTAGTMIVGIKEPFAADLERVREHALAFYRHQYESMVEHGNALRTQSVRLAWALAALALTTLAIGIWASMRIARRLTRPMDHLVRASDRVATGDFTVRTARSGLLEPDRVAQRFDEMVAALERFHAMNLDRIVAERRRLDQVVANIDDGLVIFDEAGRIERVNPVAALQLEVDPERAVGMHIDQIVAMPQLADEIQRLLAHPGAAPAAACDLVVGDDTERRTLNCSLLPFYDTARLGLILVLRDVTEQRRFERMRTDFILRASHELRTPITGMRMSIGLLRDKIQFAPDNARDRELFATLQQETERLVALITELFDLSRLYARSEQRQTGPVDPAELLERVRLQFAPRAVEAAVHLDLLQPPPLPTLDVDEEAIERVLDNLVANALRHTPAGGQVQLGASVSGEHVALWVQDTGDGIAPADRARIFEPFMQLGGKVGGAGLGLAMCREIVHQHGGRILLDSSVGEGSRFTVCLPI